MSASYQVMSLDSALDADVGRGVESSSEGVRRGSGTGHGTAPRLVPAEYAQWAADMMTYLTRCGVADSVIDEIKDWVKVVAHLQGQRRQRMQSDMASLLAGEPAVKVEMEEKDRREEKAAAERMARVEKEVSNSQRAYAIIYDSIPGELRRQTEHSISRGNAHALWGCVTE